MWEWIAIGAMGAIGLFSNAVLTLANLRRIQDLEREKYAVRCKLDILKHRRKEPAGEPYNTRGWCECGFFSDCLSAEGRCCNCEQNAKAEEA